MLRRHSKNIERLIFLTAAVITFGISFQSLRFERNLGNQKVLYYQLQAIRTSVNLFKAINKRNPRDLVELATAQYRFPEESTQRRYLEKVPINENGAIADPFGNPYLYDADRGWVSSSTKNYERW